MEAKTPQGRDEGAHTGGPHRGLESAGMICGALVIAAGAVLDRYGIGWLSWANYWKLDGMAGGFGVPRLIRSPFENVFLFLVSRVREVGVIAYALEMLGLAVMVFSIYAWVRKGEGKV